MYRRAALAAIIATILVDERPLPDETVSDGIDTERRNSRLHEALTLLSERELRIVRERRLKEEGATLESLGAELGISKERVRQIEGNALAKLKRALIARVGDPVAAGYVG